MTHSAKVAKAFADLDRAETRLARAFTKWAKARAKVRRMDKKYEKGIGETLPGELDVRMMPIKIRPWPGEKRSGK